MEIINQNLIVHSFPFMTSFIWTLEPSKGFEIGGQFYLGCPKNLGKSEKVGLEILCRNVKTEKAIYYSEYVKKRQT